MTRIKAADPMVSVTVYDGGNTIGGNKIFVEDGAGVFLDFGMNFAKHGVFFQEFLSERGARGIHDLAHLGLIPKLSIYRSDLIPSDVELSRYEKLKVKAILLSHAHLDHCGNIGLLQETLPVVSSGISVSILKAIRDTSPSSIGSEITYFSRKNPIDSDGLVLESDSSIKTPYVCRDFYCTQKVPDELRTFASERPGQDSPRVKRIQPGKLDHFDQLDLPFQVRAYEVDHSILGSMAYVLEGDTTIAYTGDFRLHGKRSELTKNFIRNAKDASILIIEGTRTSREEQLSVTEDDVFNNCLQAVEGSKKLTVADFSARNFERLYTFASIAEKTGKQLVVTAKDAYLLHAISCVEGDCPIDKGDVLIYSELKNRSGIKWETETIMKKWQDYYVSHTQIADNSGSYILCFSLFDMKHLLDIKPDGGTYVYSSSEAHSEEQDIDFVRLGQWLDFFKMKPYGFSIVAKDNILRPEFTRGYHASGHASTSDLEHVISEIDPDVIIPVHTENPTWFGKFEQTVVPEEGKRYAF
jgi:ribonuclease J